MKRVAGGIRLLTGPGTARFGPLHGVGLARAKVHALLNATQGFITGAALVAGGAALSGVSAFLMEWNGRNVIIRTFGM